MVANLVAIALGGSVGALLRYGVSTGVYAMLGRGFPWGTLAVNVAGSFAMGLLAVLMIERLSLGPQWRAAVLVGLLGSFTTFSTFSLETLELIERGQAGRALLNAAASVGLCLAAAWAGVVAARSL